MIHGHIFEMEILKRRNGESGKLICWFFLRWTYALCPAFLQFCCPSFGRCLGFSVGSFSSGWIGFQNPTKNEEEKKFCSKSLSFFLHLSRPSKVHTFEKKCLCDDIEPCLLYTYLEEPPFSRPTPFRKKLITETKSFLAKSLITQRKAFKCYQIL